MAQLDCPRCGTPFVRGARFCKSCGLRKCRPFSALHWWLSALTVDLLIVVGVGIFKVYLLVVNGMQNDISWGVGGTLLAVLGLLLLFPTLSFYPVYRALWLCRYGAVATGKVVIRRVSLRPRAGRVEVPVVRFETDIVPHKRFEVPYLPWFGLRRAQEVEVRYDPYNPGGCAQVGMGINHLTFSIALIGLLFLGLAILLIIGLFSTTA